MISTLSAHARRGVVAAVGHTRTHQRRGLAAMLASRSPATVCQVRRSDTPGVSTVSARSSGIHQRHIHAPCRVLQRRKPAWRTAVAAHGGACASRRGCSNLAGAGETDDDATPIEDIPFPLGLRGRPVGVKYNKARGTWGASIKVRGTNVYLGTYDDGEQAAAAREAAEELVQDGADAPALRAALGLPVPRVLKRTGGTGVYKDRGMWVARFQRHTQDYYVGRFETEEEARKATKAAIADVTSPAQLCSGIIEFVASEHVEAVALDPSAAEFPHGIINRPRGVQLDRKTFKWRAFININLERVHLGYFWNGSDAAAIRAQAETLVNDGFDSKHIRSELGLPLPGSRRFVDPAGFHRGRRGMWHARVCLKGRVVLDLGRFDTEQAATQAYTEAAAALEAEHAVGEIKN